VERLARTFRDTLRALEESLTGPGAQGESRPRRQRFALDDPALARPTDARPVSEPSVQTAVQEEHAAPEPEPPSVAALESVPDIIPAAAEPVETPPAAASPAEQTRAMAAEERPPVPLAAPAEPVPEPAVAPAAAADETALPPAEPEVSASRLTGSRRLRIPMRRAVAAAVEVSPSADAAEASGAIAAASQPMAVAPAPVVPPASSPGETAAGEQSASGADVKPPASGTGIEEAALIRERLPEHMAMLLRIPTNEVAQNSYKSPFRETREDLIGRLLDPQLTLEEAARVLGVCPTTVRRYTNRGMLHCHRTPGNQRRFRMSDVLQFLEQHGDRIDRAAEARHMEQAA
jgi:excisionase family DNA binding protein